MTHSAPNVKLTMLTLLAQNALLTPTT